MKALITIAIAMLASTAQVSAHSAEWCSSRAQLAKSVMDARQGNLSKQIMLAMANAAPPALRAEMLSDIKLAFELPVRRTAKAKEREIMLFTFAAREACLEGV